MNEEDIRRLFISDEYWENTSPSWKAFKPLRDFNTRKDTDETPTECYHRLNKAFDIPFDVIDQWIYPLYYNGNTVVNYGWIDYQHCSFIETTLDIQDILNLNIINDYRPYVLDRSSLTSISDFMCISKDMHHWRRHQTWRIPPIVMDVYSFNNIPLGKEFSGPLQLIEGHSRLGYLLSIYHSGNLKRHCHKVYMLRYNNAS